MRTVIKIGVIVVTLSLSTINVYSGQMETDNTPTPEDKTSVHKVTGESRLFSQILPGIRIPHNLFTAKTEYRTSLDRVAENLALPSHPIISLRSGTNTISTTMRKYHPVHTVVRIYDMRFEPGLFEQNIPHHYQHTVLII